MSLTNGQLKASDYQLSQCTLIAPTGKSVGLQDILTELNLYEDLFSSVMTGNILITDTNNLINTLPILGWEYLLLTFEKPGSSSRISKTFRIYKLTDRQRVTEQAETYLLHFASEELLLSESVLISRSYQSMTIRAMIADILTHYLQVSPQKVQVLQETSGLHSFMIPAWHPFYAINFLCRYAQTTQYKAGTFVFYEDHLGFQCSPLEQLVKSPPVQSILLTPKNAGFERDPLKPDLQIASESVEGVSFPESCDTLRNTYSGMYGGLLITVDPLRQRISTLAYNGATQFTKSPHVNKFPLFGDSTNRLGHQSTQHPEAYKQTIITNLGHDSIPYAQGKGSFHPQKREETMIPRTMYLTGIHAHRLTVTLPGSFTLRVGMTVSAHLPAATEQQTGTRAMDTLYSGNYVITAIRHKFNRRTHACVLELSKDSTATQLQNGQNLQALTEIKRN